MKKAMAKTGDKEFVRCLPYNLASHAFLWWNNIVDNFDGLLRSSMNLLENRPDPDLKDIKPKKTGGLRVRGWGVEVNLTPTHCRFSKIVSS